MSEVTKVETTRDYDLFGQVYFKGTVFYVAAPHRNMHSSISWSDVFDESGVKIGSIFGHWFDYADKTLFKCVELL